MKHKLGIAIALFGAAILVFPARAHASRDVVQFGSDIVVPQGQSIHDAVCFFCSVKVEGIAEHDLVVFFGSTQIDGEAKHDIVTFFGDVHVGTNVHIGHDVVNFFGTTRLGDNSSIGNDAVIMFGDMRAAETSSVAGNRVIQPFFLLLIPLGILAALIFGLIALIRWIQRPAYPVYPLPPH